MGPTHLPADSTRMLEPLVVLAPSSSSRATKSSMFLWPSVTMWSWSSSGSTPEAWRAVTCSPTICCQLGEVGRFERG